jgi:hypothetical protein
LLCSARQRLHNTRLHVRRRGRTQRCEGAQDDCAPKRHFSTDPTHPRASAAGHVAGSALGDPDGGRRATSMLVDCALFWARLRMNEKVTSRCVKRLVDRHTGGCRVQPEIWLYCHQVVARRVGLVESTERLAEHPVEAAAASYLSDSYRRADDQTPPPPTTLEHHNTRHRGVWFKQSEHRPLAVCERMSMTGYPHPNDISADACLYRMSTSR